MWRLIIIIGLGYLILKLAAGFRTPAKPSRPPSGPAGEAPELVRDALSGVFFDKNLALTVVLNGQTFYFISPENRDLYLTRIAPKSSTKH